MLTTFADDKLPPHVTMPQLGDFSEDKILTVLNKKVEKPVLSERERRILEVGQMFGSKQIEMASLTFSQAKTTYCPYCFRDIRNEEKQFIIKGVERVLNREVDDLRMELSSIRFPTIRTNWSEYALLDKSLVTNIETLAKQCDSILAKYKQEVQLKRDNLFSIELFDSKHFKETFLALRTELLRLENRREEIATLSKKKNEIKQTLIELYKDEAHFKIKKKYSDYLRQQGKKQSLENENRMVNMCIQQLESEINELTAKKKGTKIAVNEINKKLGLVFMSTLRMQVVPKDDCYYLKINGKDIPPSSVSTGERNVLALCYFFVDIMRDLRIEDFYKEERFLVIDDPISSFDQENKIGVYSLLVHEISKCLSNNQNSKVIVLSHDLSACLAMKSPLYAIAKQINKEKQELVHYWTLLPSAGGIAEFSKRMDEYGMLLEDIYEFAQLGDQNRALVVGNEMRRVLEAYSSFMYRVSPSELSFTRPIEQKLGEMTPYFKARMDRILLNDESHTENRIHALSHDGWVFYSISDDEKRNAAKAVLTLLYILDEEHLLSHLDTKKHPDAKQTILQWHQEIKCACTGMLPTETTNQ